MGRRKSKKTQQFKQNCKKNQGKKVIDMLEGDELKQYRKEVRLEKIKEDKEYRKNNPILNLEIGEKIVTIDRTGHEIVATNKELNMYVKDLLEGNFVEPKK